MKKAFVPLAGLTGLMFIASPFIVAHAPYESTMGLVQKIFYFHVPSWFAMFTAIGICGVSSLFICSRTGAARIAWRSPQRKSPCSSG